MKMTVPRSGFRPAVLASALALLGGGLVPALHAAGDPARGKLLFQQSCALCHTTGSEALPAAVPGPLLGGVVGRMAATVAKYSYSPAMQLSKLTWDPATLDRFLTNPTALVPGTLMPIMVPEATDRSDLIAFLATQPAVAVNPGAVNLAPSATPEAIAADPGSWLKDSPGAGHATRPESLPAPFATVSAANNHTTVTQPVGQKLAVPPGFTVGLFASGFAGPRLLRTAPNGDIFVAETRFGKIRVLRAAKGATAATANEVFVEGLRNPFGLAFYPAGPSPQWVYVGTLNAILRFPYRSGDMKARGPAEIVVPQLAETTGGHSTRDVVFSPDGRRMVIAIGSGSNVAEGLTVKTPAEIRAWESQYGFGAAWGAEAMRAGLLETDPEGRRPLRLFATGIRNPVGLAVNPANGEIWTTTNERDGLGDDLVPDYVTRVREGGFYGWPWYYIGNHEDPRHAGARPDLAGRILVPDVPVQAHSAPLGITFYTASTGAAVFPAEYRGAIFAALHGSWNRSVRTGSKIVRLRLKNGVPTGEYEDFLTGFVIDNGKVWGRPVGLTVAQDGALLVSEDGNNTVWRVAYTGRR